MGEIGRRGNRADRQFPAYLGNDHVVSDVVDMVDASVKVCADGILGFAVYSYVEVDRRIFVRER